MTTLFGILVGVATFLVSQFAAAWALAFLSTTSRAAYVLIGLNPYKFVLRLLVWSACGWLGVIAFQAVN